MSTPAVTIVLLNRALPYNVPGKVTGMTGVEYGQSFFEQAHGAHVCRMSLEEWRACRQDVTNGSIRRSSQWEVDVEFPAANEPAAFPPHGSGGLPATAYVPEDGNIDRHTVESLAEVKNFRQLLSIANKAGVPNTDTIDSAEGLRAAILAHQNAPAKE